MRQPLLILSLLLVFTPAPLLAQDECTSSTPPQPPVDLAIQRNGAEVRFSWRDPSAAVCRATRFYIEISRGGTEVREFNTTQGTVTIPDVALGSHWRYVVRGFNSRGLSAQRSLYQLEGPQQCQVPPEPVGGIVARVEGRRVDIEWVATPSCLSTGFRITAAATPDGPELYAVDVPYPNGRAWSAIAPAGTWFIRVYAEYVGRRFTAPSAWAVVVVR